MMQLPVIALTFFVSLASGRVLECRFGIVSWPILGDRYSCRATIVNEGNSSLIQEIRGDHLVGRNDSNVEGFFLTEQRLAVVPQNLGAFFPNLEGLDLSNSQLTTISSAQLSNFPRVVFVRIFNNNLTEISGDLFKSNPLIRYIDFARNSLQTVGTNLLGGL